MALQSGEDIYATLLTSDTYLPGALVLAHSLHDAGTSKKLAVLATLDTVSAEVITQLKNVYDYVISVPRIKNEASAGKLHLMNRPDLHSAFTKINLWKQAQFRKIVYIDADVVAYRAPDELFDLPHAFAAAPDIGWPDLFNTGVMVLTPNVGEYYALSAMAQRGISFDGADQGLLNMHFKNSYHRLPFTYNVTPSAHYQYLPAYRHFQSNVTMVHFIGSGKPWTRGRGASHGSGVYDEMIGQWWAVYDRHYRPANPPPEIVQYFVKGEYHPTITYRLTPGEPSLDLGRSTYGQHSETLPPPPPSQSFYASREHQHLQHSPAPPPPPPQNNEHDHGPPDQQPHYPHQHHEHQHDESHSHHDQNQPHEHDRSEPAPPPVSSPLFQQDTSHHPPHVPERPPMEPSWDARWQPPPTNAKPEAMNFPQTHYEMSRDATPFIPPPRYASPPRDMWYEVPKASPAPAHERPAAIFPWETHQPPATRVFAEPPPPPAPLSEPTRAETHSGQSGYHPHPSFQEPGAEPSMTTGSPSMDLKTEPTTPTMPSTARDVPPSDPWASFTRTNAWDGVPQIERYVDAFQKQHRRVRSRGQAPGGGLRSGTGVGDVSGGGGADDAASVPWRRGSKVTDFPSEVERPSLPVTPAPIRRSSYWGSGGPSFGADDDDAEGGDGAHLLPAADGVPKQADWDPATQLQKLAKQQSELLFQKLGNAGDADRGEASDAPRTIPLRPLPFGSENIQSPTYVAQAPPVVVSPKPIKPGGLETSSVRGIYDQGSSSSGAADAGTGGDDVTIPPSLSDTKIAEPSYLGPGIVFEKDESYPEQEVTAALPSEEEMDVLDT
ncbi:hypothetical protein HMPREF1624_04603 [Sporothrix schenckii ATCC 58251]|uniref:glycogenin glucosyltransferase n=1 Tax=Sporothrix schenckii (strain ATCC 58251 / de Perez 2211183) TaxID=1391915 RepID=U7PUW5_SPOS1|nr:hypothetical protein HMPREF1624_04603 [Sporothrix schenckii ATCC 58251]